MASIYQINKGVSKPIVFKGLKGQYIAYLAIGLVMLLLLFVILFLLRLSLFILIPLLAVLGTTLFYAVFSLSARFGEHGLMKYFARKSLPTYLRFKSRQVFTHLIKKP
jgi:hypothetical protein